MPGRDGTTFNVASEVVIVFRLGDSPSCELFMPWRILLGLSDEA